MRAVCESCARPQPSDWKAGEYCVHCGKSVRREVRCFWCAHYTPAGKFCRNCAAVVVGPAMYGAARMLKAAGVDRFAVPKMLVELDAEQIENFSNIYSRQAAVALRHVEQLRLLEKYLYQRHWSGQLEEQLAGEMPWADERLRQLDLPGPGRGEELEQVRAIEKGSPFLLTRCLATLVRFRLGDGVGAEEDNRQLHQAASDMFHTTQADLRDEAALQLTTWRAVYGAGVPVDGRELCGALRQSAVHGPAAAHLVMLGDRTAQAPEGVDGEDEFCVAIGRLDSDRLRAAMRSEDPLRRYVAAKVLIEAKQAAAIGDTLLAAAPEFQFQLLRQLVQAGKPVPELRRTLEKIAAETREKQNRTAACQALCFGVPAGEAVMVARLARGERAVYQALLQRSGLTPEDLDALCGWLLDEGVFCAQQWGLIEAAKQGGIPADFVERHWNGARDEMRVELIALGEMQLEGYADEALHRFLVRRLFEPAASGVVVQVWKCLYRWYGRTDHTRMGALRIEAQSLTRFFGRPAAFVPVLARFLWGAGSRAVLGEMWIREPLAKLVRYTDENVLAELAATARDVGEVKNLFAAMGGLMHDTGQDFILRTECAGFAAFLGRATKLRREARRLLEGIQEADMQHACKTALERMDRYEEAE